VITGGRSSPGGNVILLRVKLSTLQKASIGNSAAVNRSLGNLAPMGDIMVSISRRDAGDLGPSADLEHAQRRRGAMPSAVAA
jgi:hypothetical protein